MQESGEPHMTGVPPNNQALHTWRGVPPKTESTGASAVHTHTHLHMTLRVWALGYDLKFLTVVYEQSSCMNIPVLDQQPHPTDMAAEAGGHASS